MRTKKLRFIALVVLVVVAGALCGFRLIEFQIVNGEEYLEQTSSKSISEYTVNAARGKIVDRYGNELVTNKAGYNLVFDYAFLDEETANDTILELTSLLSELSEDWVDELPISQTQPYEFLSGRDDDVTRLKSELELQSYATAEDCMTALIKKYDITGYSDADTRTIAGVRYTMLMQDFSRYNRYTFAEDVSTATVATIEELSFRFPGVAISQESIRDYGAGDVVPHLLGSISPLYPTDDIESYLNNGYALNSLIGRGGIEGAYEEELRGSAGKVRIEQNSRGEIISETETVAPVAGNSVMLTIDMEFQKQVQQILADYIQTLQAGRYPSTKAGAVVVLDVKTGEVLAIANYPTYTLVEMEENSEALYNDPLNPTRDRALMEVYRPGSTFKTVTATAGLCEGAITEYTTFYCNGVSRFDYGNGRHPTCTGHHGNTAVVNALKMSCNVFFYEVGQMLGIDKIDQYAAYFGLGVDTGLELPNSDGWVASPQVFEDMGSTWDQGQVWQASIGQSETKVTPLQLAVQAMTIANKGTRYEAHLVKSINNYDLTQTISETQPVVASELSGHESAFDIVQHGMREAANRRSTLSHFAEGVAIKTGTPQVTSTTTNSTTIGFYPALEEPEIAVSIVLEEGEYSADMLELIINAYNDLKAQRSGQTTSAASDSSSAAE